MFYLTDTRNGSRRSLSNDFPKFDEIKDFVMWQEYTMLVTMRVAGPWMLTYEINNVDVNWSTRQVTEFHVIQRDKHIKVGFFTLECLIRLTKELSIFDFAMLLRKRFVVDCSNETVYLLE